MDYLHRYMLMQLSKSLTDEERDFLVGQTEEKRHNEILLKLDDIRRKQNFGIDVGANVVGNMAYDVAILLAKKLLKLIR